jgi:hypothetical protein
MDEDVVVEDRRRIRQQDLGPAAVVRTTTLKPAETGDAKPSKNMKTEAQQVVAAAKARDEGRDSAIEPPKKKAPKPPWSKENKALDERRVDRPKLPALQQTSPLESAELYNGSDNLNWCDKCGRALYVFPDGNAFSGRAIAKSALVRVVRCRDGHGFETVVLNACLGPRCVAGALSWEAAATLLRAEHTALEAGALMATSASDVAAFWAEEDRQERALGTAASLPPSEPPATPPIAEAQASVVAAVVAAALEETDDAHARWGDQPAAAQPPSIPPLPEPVERPRNPNDFEYGLWLEDRIDFLEETVRFQQSLLLKLLTGQQPSFEELRDAFARLERLERAG